MSVKKSPKIEKLVVGAIRKLQDVQGSTPREISNYISQEYDVPSTKIQRQVRLALARAVSYGILQRSKGGFYACNREFIGCQPQPEELKGGGKCGGGGHGMKRARSSRRRKRGGGGCCKSARKRKHRRGGCGARSRRRSRRGKSCGGKSRRRRRGGKSKCGSAKRRKSRGCGQKRRKARRRSRGGKKCAPEGNRGGKGTGEDMFSSSGQRRSRARSFSGTRPENRSGSVSLSVSDEERLDEKCPGGQAIESPETLGD